MSRNELLKKLSSEGKTDEEMIKALIAGTTDVKPIKGKNEAECLTFAKLILSKFKNPKPKKSANIPE